jgi:hypothetical protein
MSLENSLRKYWLGRVRWWLLPSIICIHCFVSAVNVVRRKWSRLQRILKKSSDFGSWVWSCAASLLHLSDPHLMPISTHLWVSTSAYVIWFIYLQAIHVYIFVAPCRSWNECESFHWMLQLSCSSICMDDEIYIFDYLIFRFHFICRSSLNGSSSLMCKGVSTCISLL